LAHRILHGLTISVGPLFFIALFLPVQVSNFHRWEEFAYITELRDPSPYPDGKEAGDSSIEEARSMKAYVVITAKAGIAREITDAMAALAGVQMADAC